MTYRDLYSIVCEYERELAYGSETALLGYYVDDMCRQRPDDPDWRSSDDMIDDDVADYWMRAYELHKADQALPADEQADDIQDMLDRV